MEAGKVPHAAGRRKDGLCSPLPGRNGDTLDSIRELIAVPLEVEEALGIHRVLKLRRKVAEEFDRLVRG